MILFYYILKDYLKYVIGTLFLCTFLFILFDFIHKTTKYFARYEPSSYDIMQFYLYQIPNQVVQALPIAALLASTVTMVLLSRTNEITAMRASGMGPLQISMPIAVGGVLLSMTGFFIGEIVAPYTSAQMHYVQDVLIEGKAKDEASQDASWLKDGDKLFNYKDYDPTSRTLTGVTEITYSENFRPIRLRFAETAVLQDIDEQWMLKNVTYRYFFADGTMKNLRHFDNELGRLPFKVSKLSKERRKTEEMSISELSSDISRGQNAGLDIGEMEVEMHSKFAFYFAAFFVSLLGLRFAYGSERSVETARGILLAIGIGVSYWFILNAFKAVGKRGELHPIVAAWSANVLILSAAMIEMYKARKQT